MTQGDAYCIKLAAVSDVRMQCETLNHLMTTFRVRAPNRTSIGCLYSSAIRVADHSGDAIDGRSGEGKFLRKCEAELVAQVRGLPSFAQRLPILTRCSRDAAVLEAFDARMASSCRLDRWAMRALTGGLSNSLRRYVARARVQIGYREAEALADVLNGQATAIAAS